MYFLFAVNLLLWKLLWNKLIVKINNSFSEITPEGRRITKLDQILLNGNNITMVEYTCILFEKCLFHNIERIVSVHLSETKQLALIVYFTANSWWGRSWSLSHWSTVLLLFFSFFFSWLHYYCCSSSSPCYLEGCFFLESCFCSFLIKQCGFF